MSDSTISKSDREIILVVMVIESNFLVSFAALERTEIGGRITALGGDYIFELE